VARLRAIALRIHAGRASADALFDGLALPMLEVLEIDLTGAGRATEALAHVHLPALRQLVVSRGRGAVLDALRAAFPGAKVGAKLVSA
jgi:hypothetical protein